MLNTLLVLGTNCYIWILTLLILEVNLLIMLMWIFLHLMEYDYQYLYLNLDLASIQTWETTIKKWIALYSLCFRIIWKIWSLVSISQILILPEEIISKSMHISPVIAKIVLANQWFHPRLISDWNMITISSLNLLDFEDNDTDITHRFDIISDVKVSLDETTTCELYRKSQPFQL